MIDKNKLAAKLNDYTLVAEKEQGVALVFELLDEGMGWRSLAELTDVNITFIKRWHNGETIDPIAKTKIAKIVALIRILKENKITTNPIAWLETPITPGNILTKMHLLVSKRFDLVLSLVDSGLTLGEIGEVLNEFDVDWKNKYEDGSAYNTVEVFIDSDGMKSLRVVKDSSSLDTVEVFIDSDGMKSLRVRQNTPIN